jgi:hypothetical protein
MLGFVPMTQPTAYSLVSLLFELNRSLDRYYDYILRVYNWEMTSKISAGRSIKKSG